MEVKLSKLGDFNEVIMLYKEMLSYAEDVRPFREFSVDQSKINILSNLFAYLRIYLSNATLEMGQLGELIGEDEIDDSAFESEEFKRLAEVLEKNSIENTKFNRLKLRNALEHADYDIIVKMKEREKDKSISFKMYGDKDVSIVLKNKDFDCKMSVFELFNLIGLYRNILEEYGSNSKIREIFYSKKIEIKSFKDIQDKIDSFRVVKFFGQKDESIEDNIEEIDERLSKDLGSDKRGNVAAIRLLRKNKKDRGNNRFSYEVSELSYDTKGFLSNYFRYLGLEGSKHLLESPLYDAFVGVVLAPEFLERRINQEANKYTFYFQNAVMDYFNGNYSEKRGFDSYINSIGEMVGFASPIIYSNMLLSLSNYCFSYVQQLNAKTNNEMFDYADIGIRGVYKRGNNSEPEKIETYEYVKKKQIDPIESEIQGLRKKTREVLLAIENKNSLINDGKKKTQYDLAKANKVLEKLRDEDAKYIVKVLVDKVKEKNEGIDKDKLDEYLRKLISTNYSIEDYEIDHVVKKELESILMEYTSNQAQEPDIFIPNIEEKKERLEELKAYGKANSCANFIGHLRNSIAHGNYKVDYSKACVNGFNKIKFHFEDCGKNGKVNFCYDVNARQLLELIDKFVAKINMEIADSELLNELIKNEEIINFRNRVSGQDIGKASFDSTVESCDSADEVMKKMLIRENKEEEEHVQI